MDPNEVLGATEGTDSQEAGTTQPVEEKHVEPSASVGEVLQSSGETHLVEAQTVALDKDGAKIYPSLFDTIPTSFAAIILGICIIGGIQWIVRKIFDHEKQEHKALTQFVTSMFAFIVGIWIADKLIAGPSAQLLWENESRDVLNFIKDITLMVFAYYFGTKANVPQDNSGGTDG